MPIGLPVNAANPRDARVLWRDLAWLLALKLLALFVLWALFFAPSHRTPVDSETTGARFALTPAREGAEP